MNPDIYLMAHGAVTVLILGQLFRMERRFGCGDVIMDRIQKNCRLFEGGCIYEKEKNHCKATGGLQEKHQKGASGP